MSEQSIKKLKKKFILIAMVSFITVMITMGGFIFLFNLILSRAEVRRVLYYIAANDGAVPEEEAVSVPGVTGRFRNPIFYSEKDGKASREDIRDLLESMFRLGRGYDTPEFFYTTRYFAVLYDENDAVTDVIVNHISSVDSDSAVELASQARKRFFKFGSFGDYYYLNTSRTEGGRIVVYLDSTSQIFMNKRILSTALIFLVLGSLITFLIMRVMVTRLIRPEIRNAELQKQFLTNASHELKTPLAVIKANTELMEVTGGESEWTESTMRQVERLQGLIENLVMITRAQEQDSAKERTAIDAADIVKQTVQTFETVAAQEGVTLSTEIPEDIRFSADESDIRQLTSLLTDNAIKYCDKGGTVKVTLQTSGLRGKSLRLGVSNDFADGKDVDYDRFFERFYRADDSHNTEKGGYGIGLSIAEQLVKRYNGGIKVSWNEGVITFDCVMS